MQRFWVMLVGGALAAGWLFSWAGVPAAWFLGPMIVAGVMACWRDKQQHFPSGLELVAQAIIGGAVSSAMSPAALEAMARYWLIMLIILVVLLVLSLAGGVALARFSSIDMATALLGMMPGGAPGMVVLSEVLGGDTRLVAVMQTLRVMLVLGLLALVTWLVVPINAAEDNAAALLPSLGVLARDWPLYLLTIAISVLGAWGGVRLGLPAGALVGPALLGAALGLLGVRHADWPPLVLFLSYAAIGIEVGLQFNLQAIRTLGKLAPVLLASTLALVGSAALLAWVLTLLTGIDMFSAYLATTPGGLNMVTIVALESNANVPLVLTVGLLRFLVIMLAGPPFVRWLVRRFPPDPPPEPDTPGVSPRKQRP